MFGLFDNDLKRVRKLRLEYEDIRQRYLYKMNRYQQYSFITGYEAAERTFEEIISSIQDHQTERWRQLGDTLKDFARRSWRDASRMGGLGGEGAVAGVDGLALLALQCSAKGHEIAESLTLKRDIQAFIVEARKSMDASER